MDPTIEDTSFLNSGDPLYGNSAVGLQTNGTYNIPVAAQPNNLPMDNGAGTIGNYPNAIALLQAGVGAWSQVQNVNSMVDYRRVEATNGGAFIQGQPAGVATVSVATSGSKLILPLLIVAALFFVLKK